MKKFIQEFKEFALKGSMFDMAVGLIMGSAITSVVSSLVNDIITPIIKLCTGGTGNMANSVWVFNGVEFTYGNFINQLLSFLITAFVIFMMVKGMNRLRALTAKKEAEEVPSEPEVTTTDKLLAEILEELKKNK